MLSQLFDGPQLSLFIKSGKQFFPNTKAVRLPIIKKISIKITRHQPINSNQLNFDTEFKVALESLMRISKTIITAA